MKKLSEWRIAKSISGNEISVKIIPLKRMQNSIEGHKWVEVDKKIQLECGQEIEFNLDRKSFYISHNQLYRLS